jgi:HPt (histidine-containing phosphotransfer) domain-containing protein
MNPRVSRAPKTCARADTGWAPQVLDSPALRRMVGADPLLRAQFGRHFRSLAADFAAAMQIAVDQAEWAVASVLARRLASGASAVGALALGACCEHLELAYARRDQPAAAALMVHFECQLALADAWLR